MPNGEITAYFLTRYSLGSSTEIALNTSALGVVNGSFVYNDTHLLPFTNYTYTLTVCTSPGCTTSREVWAITLEAIPTGLDAPLVSTINESSLLVSWESPAKPNGLIQSYRILEHSLGFEFNGSVDVLTNCCEEYFSSNTSDYCREVANAGPDTYNYTVTDLQAYSNYQYCIVATNRAGSIASPNSLVTRTSAAPMPLSSPELNATAVNSTAIHLLWSSLDISQLRGPFEGYILYGREDGVDYPEEVIYSGNEQMFTIAELVASTDYIFVVCFNYSLQVFILSKSCLFHVRLQSAMEEGKLLAMKLLPPQRKEVSGYDKYMIFMIKCMKFEPQLQKL